MYQNSLKFCLVASKTLVVLFATISHASATSTDPDIEALKLEATPDSKQRYSLPSSSRSRKNIFKSEDSSTPAQPLGEVAKTDSESNIDKRSEYKYPNLKPRQKNSQQTKDSLKILPSTDKVDDQQSKEETVKVWCKGWNIPYTAEIPKYIYENKNLYREYCSKNSLDPIEIEEKVESILQKQDNLDYKLEINKTAKKVFQDLAEKSSLEEKKDETSTQRLQLTAKGFSKEYPTLEAYSHSISSIAKNSSKSLDKIEEASGE